MRVVGIRELKDQLSRYLRVARDGESVLVTDRGRVVAELRPFDDRSGAELPGGMAELVRIGSLRLPVVPHRPERYPRRPPVTKPGTARRLLDEQRGGQ
jgi:prevent-host-death family protein